MTFSTEIIGDATLILGDCREVLPTLGKVDAVVDNLDAVVFNQKYEKSAKRQHRSPPRSNEIMGASPSEHRCDVHERAEVSESNGDAVRCHISGFSESVREDEHPSEIKRPYRNAEWSVQGWDAKHGLPENDREGTLQQMRRNALAGDSPHGRDSHEQHCEQSRSALLAMSHELPQARMVALTKGWSILNDTPYRD